MKIKTKEDFLKLVQEDSLMMDVLRAVKTLNLPDCWVCAGFVRSKLWDAQHGYEKATELPDVDVIYFDRDHIDEDEEVSFQNELKSLMTNIPWSVKNQARMHVLNDVEPYTSTVDAISKFPETATSLGLKLDNEDNLVLAAPHGLDDAIHMKVRPTPNFLHNEQNNIFKRRVLQKDWASKWPMVEVVNLDEGV